MRRNSWKSNLPKCFVILACLLFFSCIGTEEEVNSVMAVQKIEQRWPSFPYQENTFTGSKQIKEVQYVNGIIFSQPDSISLKYRFTLLEDWKMTDEIKGHARLIISRIQDSMEVDSRTVYPAYVYVDSIHKLKIFFSKDSNGKSAYCKVQSTKILKPIPIMRPK